LRSPVLGHERGEVEHGNERRPEDGNVIQREMDVHRIHAAEGLKQRPARLRTKSFRLRWFAARNAKSAKIWF
jgi:hypothetical protein